MIRRDGNDDGTFTHKATTKRDESQPTSCPFQPYITSKPQQKRREVRESYQRPRRSTSPINMSRCLEKLLNQAVAAAA